MKKIVIIVALAMAAEAGAADTSYRTEACAYHLPYGGSGGRYVAPNDGGPIHVIGAAYGGTGAGSIPTAEMGVTNRVASLCDGKYRCRFDINNNAMGGDPVPRRDKYLAVHFACFDPSNPASLEKYRSNKRVYERGGCKNPQGAEPIVRVDKEGSYMEIWCEGH